MNHHTGCLRPTQATGTHSYIKEVQFHTSRGPGPPPPPPPPPPPSPLATEYALYYLPHPECGQSGGCTGLRLNTHYDARSETASAAWLAANGLGAARQSTCCWHQSKHFLLVPAPVSPQRTLFHCCNR